uniref:Uncharacterized protein n=1 Tax=Rhizophora mucronata TaxID=61149 RepID=A0A2P2PFQ4_RHIMU
MFYKQINSVGVDGHIGKSQKLVEIGGALMQNK